MISFFVFILAFHFLPMQLVSGQKVPLANYQDVISFFVFILAFHFLPMQLVSGQKVPLARFKEYIYLLTCLFTYTCIAA